MTTETYFVRVGTEVRGPYGPEQLRQLAEVGVVDEATAAAREVGGPWMTLAAHPDRSVIFPTRPRLGFKTAEAAPATAPGGERPPAVAEMIAAAAVPGRILRPPPSAPPQASSPERPPPNEVEVMVREVQAIKEKFTPPPPPRPWRASGRLKLCLGLAVVVNGTILALPMVYGSWDDWWSMLLVRGWFVVGNGGLAVLYFQLPKD